MSPLSPERAPHRSRNWILAMAESLTADRARRPDRLQLVHLDAHLGIDERAVDQEGLDRQELGGPAPAAAAHPADRRGPGEAEHAYLTRDAARRLGIGRAPGQTADHLGGLAAGGADG